jgi:hypothetical protein
VISALLVSKKRVTAFSGVDEIRTEHISLTSYVRQLSRGFARRAQILFYTKVISSTRAFERR